MFYSSQDWPCDNELYGPKCPHGTGREPTPTLHGKTEEQAVWPIIWHVEVRAAWQGRAWSPDLLVGRVSGDMCFSRGWRRQCKCTRTAPKFCLLQIKLKYQLMWWALVSKGSNSCCTSTTCVTLELTVPQYLVPPSSPFGEIKGHSLCEVLSTVLCTWKY